MVALQARAVEAFLPDLSIHRIFLCYGPDGGRVSALAWRLLAHMGAKKEDSFSYTTLEGDLLASFPGRLLEEGGALMLFSPCRALRVSSRGHDKAVAKALEIYMESSQGLPVVIEAGDLERQAPLRLFCERAPFGVSLPCYGDDPQALMAMATEFFRSRGVRCDSDVYPLLGTWLGADRKNTESELEKLACYAYGRSHLSADDVLALLGDGAAVFANTVIDYAYEGSVSKLDRDFSRFLAQGHSPQMLLTAGIAHGFFLMDEISGGSTGGSMVHFKRKSSIQRQRQRWTLRRLSRAVAHVSEAQMHLRQTAMTSDLERAYVRMALLELALGF